MKPKAHQRFVINWRNGVDYPNDGKKFERDDYIPAAERPGFDPDKIIKLKPNGDVR